MSSLRASIFRISLALILVAFAGTSFWYAYRLQEKYLEQEGYLWNARRENFLLRSVVGDVETDRDRLGREVATLGLALEDAREELSRLKLQATDLELTLIDVRAERDAWQAENRELDRDRLRLHDENKALTSQVFSLYMAANSSRWIDGMRDAGAWLDGIMGGGKVAGGDAAESPVVETPRWIAAADPQVDTRDEVEARLAALRNVSSAVEERRDESAAAEPRSVAWADENEDRSLGDGRVDDGLPTWGVAPASGSSATHSRPSLRPAPAMQSGIPTASLGRGPAAREIFRMEALRDVWVGAPAALSGAITTLVERVRRDGRSWVRIAHTTLLVLARVDGALRSTRFVSRPRL